jgi:hypothetical protein
VRVGAEVDEDVVRRACERSGLRGGYRLMQHCVSCRGLQHADRICPVMRLWPGIGKLGRLCLFYPRCRNHFVRRFSRSTGVYRPRLDSSDKGQVGTRDVERVEVSFVLPSTRSCSSRAAVCDLWEEAVDVGRSSEQENTSVAGSWC